MRFVNGLFVCLFSLTCASCERDDPSLREKKFEGEGGDAPSAGKAGMPGTVVAGSAPVLGGAAGFGGVLSTAGASGTDGGAAGAPNPDALPIDPCTCSLAVGSVEETGDYPSLYGDDVALIPGYGVYDRYCDIPLLAPEGDGVHLSFDCDPQEGFRIPTGGIPTFEYRQLAWVSVRKSFSRVQDFTCCSGIDVDLQTSATSILCPCTDGTTSAECCFDDYGLVRAITLRMTLVDIASATLSGATNEELWWYDFPGEPLLTSSEWRRISAPVDGFVLGQGDGVGMNDRALRLDLIRGIEINVAITLGTAGVAKGSGQPYDNYVTAHVLGDLSFRDVRTLCE